MPTFVPNIENDGITCSCTKQLSSKATIIVGIINHYHLKVSKLSYLVRQSFKVIVTKVQRT